MQDVPKLAKLTNEHDERTLDTSYKVAKPVVTLLSIVMVDPPETKRKPKKGE